MRAFVVLLLIIGLVGLASGCGKDNPTSPSHPLIGTWELVSVNGNLVDEPESFKLTFNADGTFSASDGDIGTYTISGDTLIVKGEGKAEADPPVPFTVNGNTLTLTLSSSSVWEYTRV